MTETMSLFTDTNPGQRQLNAVRSVMLSAGDSWLTFDEIQHRMIALPDGQRCYARETSISARLRDLRKEGRTVDSRQRSRGLWEYRITGGAK